MTVGSQTDSIDHLIERLRRIGSDTAHVEVKAASGGLPRSTGETLSAFANGRGGRLILGLSEENDFRPAEGFVAKRIQDALARLCADDMEPPIRGDVEIALAEGAPVVVLDVPPLDPVRQPCYIKRKGAYEGSFIRGGDGDRHLTAYEVTQLLANRTQPEDDARPVAGATLEDLDEERVTALLRRLRARSPRAFADLDTGAALRRAGAAMLDTQGDLRPTVAGLLCLGLFPQQFLPQVFVSFVALPGLTLGDSLDDGTRFLDNVTCDGPIPAMIDSLLVAARRNMRTAAVIRDGGREDRFDYPLEVIRELVVNALLHRDYSPMALGTQVQVELYPNRLVVKSPGGLYGSVVPSQLGVEDVSSTRNAVLARLLADVPGDDGLSVSENRGSGLSRVMTRLRKAGMSPPRFDITPGHVHVSLSHQALLGPQTVEWIGSLGQPGLSDDQHLALALMRDSDHVSNEMLRAWGVDSLSATTALRDLVDRGLAIKYGGRRYATYELVPEPVRSVGVEDSNSRGSVTRERRISAELRAVVEAIRAGHTTSRAIADQLELSYPATVRRLNRLLEQGEIVATAPANSRHRTYAIQPADPSPPRQIPG